MKIKFIILILCVCCGISSFSKRVVFDFSDLSMSHVVEDKTGDYDKYVFEKDGLILSFNDALWKVSDNYYYLKMKKSSTVGGTINFTDEDDAIITRIVYRFHSASTANKITISDNNIDTTIDLVTVGESYYSSCDISLNKLLFKSTLGNSMIKEIIVYYYNDKETEIVKSVSEFIKNSNNGIYELCSPIVVNRIENVGYTYINNEGVEVADTIKEIYGSDGTNGICIQIPMRMIDSNYVLPIKGSILNNLKGVLKVSYNVDDSFKESPIVVCNNNHLVSFSLDNSLAVEDFIISDINPLDVANDININREFLLTSMILVYVEDCPYYASIDSETEILLPVKDRFGVLNSLINESGEANFILSKEYSDDISEYVAYPLDKESLTDLDSVYDNYENEDFREVKYFDINGILLQTTPPSSIYIKVSKNEVEKVINKN